MENSVPCKSILKSADVLVHLHRQHGEGVKGGRNVAANGAHILHAFIAAKDVVQQRGLLSNHELSENIQ